MVRLPGSWTRSPRPRQAAGRHPALSAYVATAELDGYRARDALRRSGTIASDFLDVSDIEDALSVYEQLQGAADALARFLLLPQHPLSDICADLRCCRQTRRLAKDPDAVSLLSHR
jgi:hypothetical protein